ncbi:MAG: outer-membrane lipoprotein carrier protein LolA [Ignavibacteriaceae bacterium]
MKFLINCLSLLTILLNGNVTSQAQGDSLLKDLQTKFDSIEDVSVDFVQSHNDTNILSGVLKYKTENKLRIDTKKLLIISDGSTSWNFNESENKVIISNYEENSSGLLSISELVYEFPKGCDVSSNIVDDKRILILIPNSYTVNFDKVQIWLTDDNLIDKVKISDASMGTTELIFSNYRLNQNLSLSEFSFTPPKGSKIIDLR